MRTIILDTGPLGEVVHGNKAIRRPVETWLTEMIMAGAQIAIPAIADYELRRELYRSNFLDSIVRLDELSLIQPYLHLNRDTIDTASRLWAEARNRGQKTADDRALDADVLLCATAKHYYGDSHLIATTNLKHISRFAHCKIWNEITVDDLD